ncbi:hypothetical protein [Companilactobacillus heilongjiangensis]|uniref:hypothetical protein n=1 Tax=Companilactobacillus heilongjiangensis TaxID=1074467 RepID=UPI0010F543A5|nr:hypothetical protein [Companilactobacillus heilongjiangensis]
MLQQLNDSTKNTAGNKYVQSLIRQAYLEINKSDNINKQYKEIPNSVSRLKASLQLIAIQRKYHFNAYQNNLINNLDSVHQKSFIQQLSSLINGPSFFHS